MPFGVACSLSGKTDGKKSLLLHHFHIFPVRIFLFPIFFRLRRQDRSRFFAFGSVFVRNRNTNFQYMIGGPLIRSLYGRTITEISSNREAYMPVCYEAIICRI